MCLEYGVELLACFQLHFAHFQCSPPLLRFSLPIQPEGSITEWLRAGHFKGLFPAVWLWVSPFICKIWVLTLPTSVRVHYFKRQLSLMWLKHSCLLLHDLNAVVSLERTFWGTLGAFVAVSSLLSLAYSSSKWSNDTAVITGITSATQAPKWRPQEGKKLSQLCDSLQEHVRKNLVAWWYLAAIDE